MSSNEIHYSRTCASVDPVEKLSETSIADLTRTAFFACYLLLNRSGIADIVNHNRLIYSSVTLDFRMIRAPSEYAKVLARSGTQVDSWIAESRAQGDSKKDQLRTDGRRKTL